MSQQPEIALVVTGPVVGEILSTLISSKIGPEASFVALGAVAKTVHQMLIKSSPALGPQARDIINEFDEESILQLIREGYFGTNPNVTLK